MFHTEETLKYVKLNNEMVEAEDKSFLLRFDCESEESLLWEYFMLYFDEEFLITETKCSLNKNTNRPVKYNRGQVQTEGIYDGILSHNLLLKEINMNVKIEIPEKLKQSFDSAVPKFIKLFLI